MGGHEKDKNTFKFSFFKNALTIFTLILTICMMKILIIPCLGRLNKAFVMGARRSSEQWWSYE